MRINPSAHARSHAIVVRRGRDVRTIWRDAKCRGCDAFERAGLALGVGVEAQQLHDVVDSLDAPRDASAVSSRSPSGNFRFSQNGMARNSIKRAPAHSVFHDSFVSAPAGNAPISTANARGDDVSIGASIDRQMPSANAKRMQSSRRRSLRERMRALAFRRPNDG